MTISRFVGDRVVTPTEVLFDHEVIAEDGFFVSVKPYEKMLSEGVVRAPLLLPGLVDLHCHGAVHNTFNSAVEDDWMSALDAHRANGTTSVLATLASDRTPLMIEALRLAERVVGSKIGLHDMVTGVHLEGPFLSELQRGAHPAESLATPADSWREFDSFLSVVKLLTLAPELPGALQLIERCQQAGVKISVGHSTASVDELARARDAGLTHAAHLWSGHSILTKDGPWRRLGMVDDILASDDLTAEVIADGVHVPAPLVRIAYRCLGPDRMVLVSDASAGAGLSVGASFSMGAIRGVVADSVAMNDDGTTFCGSTSFLFDVLRYAIATAGIPLSDAVRMASATPANIAGMTDRGRIAVGARSDLLLVDNDFQLKGVVTAAGGL